MNTEDRLNNFEAVLSVTSQHRGSFDDQLTACVSVCEAVSADTGSVSAK